LGDFFQAFQEVLSQRERWEQKILQKYEQLQQQYIELSHKYHLLQQELNKKQQLQQQVGLLQQEITNVRQEIAGLHKKLDSQSQSQQQEDVSPESAVGYDYTQLRDLLAKQKWRQADEETAKAMLKVAGREKEGCLRAEDIENFPCEDLQTIDCLWVKYSNGKFGFSVQKEIYQSLGRDEDYETVKKFADMVGWREDGKWKSYGELCFYGNHQPAGHLPGVGRICLCWVLLWLFVLFSRADACKL
jgi:hypothetical protein